MNFYRVSLIFKTGNPFIQLCPSLPYLIGRFSVASCRSSCPCRLTEPTCPDRYKPKFGIRGFVVRAI